MSRKQMPLLVGGLVVLLLVVALSYLLFSTQGRYADAATGLTLTQGKLQRLSGRAVFPSAGNVKTLGKQLEIYQEYLDGLYDSMRAGQRVSQPVNRDGFRRMLEDGLTRLVKHARAKSVTLPPDISFGVQRYIAGNPPSDEDLPRLVNQFTSIITLCEILFEAGIGELVSVERTVFEKDAQAAPVEEQYSRRRMRNRAETVEAAPRTELFQDPDGLFTKEHYVLTYRAQDAANRKVLDRLSQGAPFVVVTQVEISNPARPAVAVPKSGGAGIGAETGLHERLAERRPRRGSEPGGEGNRRFCRGSCASSPGRNCPTSGWKWIFIVLPRPIVLSSRGR